MLSLNDCSSQVIGFAIFLSAICTWRAVCYSQAHVFLIWSELLPELLCEITPISHNRILSLEFRIVDRRRYLPTIASESAERDQEMEITW